MAKSGQDDRPVRALKKGAKVNGGQRKATGNWTLTVQDKAAD
jgi:subtilisin-like proprotein convertase family protein